MKKGQVSWFIVFGIVLLIIVLLLYWLNSIINSVNTETYSPENVENFVSGCLDISAGKAVRQLSLDGGYISPDHTITVFGRRITLLDSTNVPGRQELGSRLETITARFMQPCIDDFSKFPVDIQAGSMSIDAEIYEKSVIISMEYPLTYKVGDALRNPTNFNTRLDNTPLLYTFSQIQAMLDQYDGSYNMTHLQSLDIDTKAYDYKDAIIFDFNDNNHVHAVFAVQ